MSDHAARAILPKAVIAAALAGLAWYGAVRPAQASLDDARRRLSLQEAEIRALTNTTDAETSEQTLNAVRALSMELQGHLSQPPGASRVLGVIDQVASASGVRVMRSSPQASASLDNRRQNNPSLIADTYSVDVEGAFSAVVNFLRDLPPAAGVSRLTQARFTPTGSDRVRAVIEFSTFRLKPGVSLMPEDRGGHADAE